MAGPTVADLQEIHRTQVEIQEQNRDDERLKIEGITYGIMKALIKSLPAGWYVLPGDVLLLLYQEGGLTLSFASKEGTSCVLDSKIAPEDEALLAFALLLRTGWPLEAMIFLERMGASEDALVQFERTTKCFTACN